MVYISNTVRTFSKGDVLASACFWFKLLSSVGYSGCWRRVFFKKATYRLPKWILCIKSTIMFQEKKSLILVELWQHWILKIYICYFFQYKMLAIAVNLDRCSFYLNRLKSQMAHHHYLQETNSSFVTYSSLGLCFAIIVMGMVQVVVLKSLFVGRINLKVWEF